jgi:hypothetical protein
VVLEIIQSMYLEKVEIRMINIPSKILEALMNTYKHVQKSKAQDKTKLNAKITNKQVEGLSLEYNLYSFKRVGV